MFLFCNRAFVLGSQSKIFFAVPNKLKYLEIYVSK